jgi:hypothetical protein
MFNFANPESVNRNVQVVRRTRRPYVCRSGAGHLETRYQ